MRPLASLTALLAAALSPLSCATVREQPTWATSRWIACEEWVAEASCGYARRGPQRWVSQQGASWHAPSAQGVPFRGYPPAVQGCLEGHSARYLEQPEPAKLRLLLELGCPKQIVRDGVTAEDDQT